MHCQTFINLFDGPKMTEHNKKFLADAVRSSENIAYVKDMLGELRNVAKSENADLLSYLIEMAYVEAGEVQASRQNSDRHDFERNKATRVAR
jgi:hypothetical protein